MTMHTDSRAGMVRIVAEGLFGGEVAEHLSTLLHGDGRTAQVAHGPLGARLADFMTGGAACVRISWRDIGDEFDEFADAATAAGRPFLPVAFAHPYVRVGPAVVPGLAPCHACYSARVRQFADEGDSVNDECEQALSRDARLGVTGYPPHVAAMAAGLALAMLGPVDDACAQVRVGQLARIDCGTDVIRTWRVTPVHGCLACGPLTNDEARAKARRDRLRSLARPATGEAPGKER
jgi:bacteriocin biosynthesis cyclodehydratase domain-containing protein